MTEDQVRKIAQEVYMQNQTSGQFSPVKIPLHTHNGIDNTRIPYKNLGIDIGASDPIGVVAKNNAPTVPPFQTFNGNTNVFPVPIVSHGNGGGFNGGNAPDGTVLLEADGIAIGSNLWVMFQGTWYGFNCDTTTI